MYVHVIYIHRYVYTRKTILKKYKRVSEEQVNEMVAGGVGSLTGFSDCFSEGRVYHTFDANTSSREDGKTKLTQGPVAERGSKAQEERLKSRWVNGQ